MSRQRPDDHALARFYAHLAVATAVQLAVLVAALARHAIGAGPSECYWSPVSDSQPMARLRSLHG
jgi:hypothetical protein